MKTKTPTTTKQKRKKVRKNNPTYNYAIPLSIQKRELIEYEAGILKEQHELYMGERL